jgi:predicted ester cyclase
MFRSAFPDLHQEIEDLVAEGDTVAVRVTMTVTHLGPFLGVAPTGRRVRYDGMDFFRFREGKTVEHWTATDDLGLMQQLGVVPSSEPWSRPLPA